jgi:hypothetical protein
MHTLPDRRRELPPEHGDALADLPRGAARPGSFPAAPPSLLVPKPVPLPMKPGGPGERGARFSAYLAALDARSGLEPAACFPAFWSALRHELERELARRGLKESPPRYLGVAAAEGYWTPEALEELATDAYVFLLERSRALLEQLAVKGDVDGLVCLNLRHFVHERRKQHDLLGYRIYEAVRAAVEKGVVEGFLDAEPAAPPVSNRTVLTCRRPGAVRELQALAESWCDELLPDLVTATGKGRPPVVARLAERLRGLGGAGRVSFKELLDAVKRTVRARWQAVRLGERGELARDDGDDDGWGELVPVVRPEASYEERQSFERLIARVGEAVAQAGGSAEKQAHLATLWQFLRTVAADADEPLLSRRRVAELLGLPRYRLPELYGELQRLIADCREPGRRTP